MPDALTPSNNGAGAAGHRILVVDDEENVRLTTAAILEHEGYTVETASDGREALHAVGRGHFDLVLTDLRMEDMDGITLLHELQTRHPNLVTVVLTGYASIESSIDALRQGVYDYLVKPCVVDDLKRTIRRALQHREQRARISELSSPVVEVWDRILLLPVVGTLDDADLVKLGVELEDICTRRRLADGLRLALELVDLEVRGKSKTASRGPLDGEGQEQFRS